MSTGMIRFAYIAGAATIVGGTGLYVVVRDASPALMVPAVLAGSGVYAIGRGVLALVRGTVVVRIGTTVDRGSSSGAFWFIVLFGRFGLGVAALAFAAYLLTGA